MSIFLYKRLKQFYDYLCDNYIDETSKFNTKIWASSSMLSDEQLTVLNRFILNSKRNLRKHILIYFCFHMYKI